MNITIPLLPFDPDQLIIVPEMHDASEILTALPVQTESDAGAGVTEGAGLIVTVFEEKVTVFPQASVITGGGTVRVLEAPHDAGHPGMVKTIEATPLLKQEPDK